MSVAVGLRLLAVAVGVPALAWAFGSAALRRVFWLDDDERFAASWGVGFATMALGQFVAFATGADPKLVGLVVVAGMVAVVAWGLTRSRAGRPPLGLFALGYAHLLLIQAVLSIYIGANWHFDWWMHYDEALVLLGSRPIDVKWAGVYTLASRTPLYNLTTASVMALAGREFWVFQLASVATNYAFVAAGYLVMRDLFGPRVARLGLVLAPLNVWLLHIAWFTWSKMLTAYFLALGFHFYSRSLRVAATDPGLARRMFFLFWVASLLAFMTHQVAVVYLAALLVHASYVGLRRGLPRPRLADLAALGLAAAAIVGPWYVWLARAFGLAGSISTTPTSVMEPGVSFGPASIARAVAENLVRSVVPDLLIRAAASGPSRLSEVYARLTALYFCQLPGLLTLSLTLALLVGFGSWLRRRTGVGPTLASPEGAAAVFAVLGGLGAMALHPQKQPYGIFHATSFPSALLIALAAWGWLARQDRRWRRVVLGGMVVEFGVMFWSHLASIGHTDPRQDNWILKSENQLVFVADLLGAWRLAALVGCGAVQIGLLTVLARGTETIEESKVAR